MAASMCLLSLLRGFRIEYVSLMHVYEVLGKSQLRVELLATNVAHADLWIASLFVLLSICRPPSRAPGPSQPPRRLRYHPFDDPRHVGLVSLLHFCLLVGLLSGDRHADQ